MRKFIQYLRNEHIAHLTAGLAFILAYLMFDHPSLIVKEFIAWGVPIEAQAAILCAGGILILLSGKDVWKFYFGSIPLAMYLAASFVVTIKAGTGYQTAFIYLYTIILMLWLYAKEMKEHGH